MYPNFKKVIFKKFLFLTFFPLIFFLFSIYESGLLYGLISSKENVPQKNEINYAILVGAKGRQGKGAIYKCSLDGASCSEYLGGALKFKADSNPKIQPIRLNLEDYFGSSIFAFNDKIFIGAIGRDNRKANNAENIASENYKDDIGSITQCNLNGMECFELIGGHSNIKNKKDDSINLFSGDFLGSSIFIMNNKIYIGAMGRDSAKKENTGAIFQCSLTNNHCSEFISGKNKYSKIYNTLHENDGIGSSILINKNNLFIGAKNKNFATGGLLHCDLEGEKCNFINTKELKLDPGDGFGSSLASSEGSIFIGTMGRNSIQSKDSGSIFKCNTKAEECKEIIGGKNDYTQMSKILEEKDYFGSSLIIFNDSIYIGAVGRKNKNNEHSGAVFQCSLDGKNCKELLAGKNQKTQFLDNSQPLEGDLFGSSIAIVGFYAKPRN